MPHIFISYAKKDTRPLAEKIFMTINDMEGFSAWMDKSLEAGNFWAQEISDEIHKADLVIVLLSPDVNRPPSATQRRSFVLNEIDYAQQLHKLIVPIMAQQTISPVQIAGIEYIDFTKNEQTGMERLIGRILTKNQESQPYVAKSSKQAVSKVSTKADSATAIFILVAILLTGIWYIFSVVKNYQTIRETNASQEPTLIISPTIVPTPIALDESILNSSLEIASNFSGTNYEWQPMTYVFDDGISMVLVPKGCIQLGNDPQIGVVDGRRNCFDSFWIDQTEVAQGDFTRLGGKKANPSYFSGENRPVEVITWFESRDFCEQRGGRLPTEAEWEYAARGVDNLIYPWGNNWDETNVIWNRSESQGSADVGTLPSGASWVGALDMSGNVWEWVNTIYGIEVTGDNDYSDIGERLFSYPYYNEDGREQDSDNGAFVRIVRGGSWNRDLGYYVHGASRYFFNPIYSNYGGGFRCVRDIP